LEAQNPVIVDGLKIGQVLTITKKTVIETVVPDDEFDYYTVKPQEAFYSLTKKLGVSKDSLEVLNPSLVDGLKVGMVLKYPKNKFIKSEVASFNLLDSISNYNTQHITLMLPLMLDKIVENDSVSNIKKVVMRYRNTNASLDFYSGVLMAVDSMKTAGISTKLRVFDTEYNRRDAKANSKRVTTLLANSFEENEVVIGPLVAANVTLVAEGLAEKNIPVLAPFALKKSSLHKNLFQTATAVNYERDQMIHFLESYGVGKPIIIIADEKMNAVKNELLAKFPTAKIINPREGNLLIPKDFDGLLNEVDENIVIVEAAEVGLVATVTSILDTKVKNHKITLFTTSSKKTFDNPAIANRYKAKLNFHFPSGTKELAFEKGDAFVNKYQDMYGKLPSKYARRGYDLAMDVLLRQAVSTTIENAASSIGETSYLENKFNYYKSATGGYVNKAMYILRYTPELTIVEANIVSSLIEEE